MIGINSHDCLQIWISQRRSIFRFANNYMNQKTSAGKCRPMCSQAHGEHCCRKMFEVGKYLGQITKVFKNSVNEADSNAACLVLTRVCCMQLMAICTVTFSRERCKRSWVSHSSNMLYYSVFNSKDIVERSLSEWVSEWVTRKWIGLTVLG